MSKQFEIVGNFFPKVKAYCHHNRAESCVKDLFKADKKGKIAIKFIEKAVTSEHIGNEKVIELVKKLLENIEQNKKGKISKKVTHQAKELKKQFKEKVKDLTKTAKVEKAKKEEISKKETNVKKEEKKPEKSGKDEKEEFSVKKPEEMAAQNKKTPIEEVEELFEKFPRDMAGLIGSYLVGDILKEVKGNLNDPKIAELKVWLKQIGHNLDSLDLTDSELTNDQLSELVAFFPNLERVHVHIPKANDRTLELFSGLKNLKDLEISNKHYEEHTFTAAGLNQLQKLEELEHLSLGWPTSTISDAICKMEPLTKLKSFHVHADLTHALKTIAKFSELKNLSLHRCYFLSDEGIGHLAALTKLESLEIKDGGNLTNESLKTIGQLHLLNTIKLGFQEAITGEGLTHLGNLHALHTLEIGGTFQDDDLKHLGSLINLHTLAVTSHQIKGSGIKHLAALQNLRHITIEGKINRYQGDIVCQELAKLKLLRSVKYDYPHYPYNRITDKSFEALSSLPELESLEVASQTNCTEKAFQALTKLEKLTSLKLTTFMPQEEAKKGLLHLAKLKALTSLAFEEPVNDAMFEAISKISTLEKLSVGFDNSDYTSDLTDNGIKHVVHLSKLKELNLNYCEKITKKSVEQFAKLPSLSRLWISCTFRTIKDKAFAVLRNKGVQVVHPY